MNVIWANRLVAGTKTWGEVPDFREDGIKVELKRRVAGGKITADRYKEITSEEYAA